jgi:hypothetical protein
MIFTDFGKVVYSLHKNQQLIALQFYGIPEKIIKPIKITSVIIYRKYL